MSDLLKKFSFDLQRFDVVIEQLTGQSGILTDIELDAIGVNGYKETESVVTALANANDNSFDGQYFWDNSAANFAENFAVGTESGVQLSIQYDEYQVTGMSIAGGNSSDVYSFRKITGLTAIDFDGSYSVEDISNSIPIESNELTLGSLWTGDAESSITISSETPLTIDASGAGVGQFILLGESVALDSFVIDATHGSIASINLNEGTLATKDNIPTGTNLNLEQGAGLVVTNDNGVSGIMVDNGSGSAAELTVNKPFIYAVDDETTIALVASSAVVSNWDHATKIVPAAAATGDTITVGDEALEYASGGSAAIIVDSNGVKGFELAEKGDKITFASSNSATYGVNVLNDDTFIEGDLDFAALSKDGYSAELTNVGSDSSYEIEISRFSKSVDLNENNGFALNNNSGSAILTIDDNGALLAVKLGIDDEIVGDVSELGGESGFT